MGYTHYWDFKQSPNTIKNGQEKFKKSVALLQRCIAKIPAEISVELWSKEACGYKEFKIPFRLAGGNGTGEPIFTDTSVVFNGKYEKGNDQSYETFAISMNDNEGFNFCKTARCPYDVAVCLALLCFKKCFGKDFSYSSDGDIKDEGWAMAHQIFNEETKK